MSEIQVLLGDITALPADAIVNSANPSLLAGSGVSGAIHRAAGPKLEEACRAIGGCSVGCCVVTPAFALPASWVIHAVGPRWMGGTKGEARDLEQCYISILEAARGVGARKVTVPSISTGIYRFPLGLAAEIAIRTVRTQGAGIESIHFVCFDHATAGAYAAALAEQDDPSSAPGAS